LAGEIELPVISGWQISEEWAGDTRPTFFGFASEAAVFYDSANIQVGVYIANFPVQQQGQEAIYYLNRPAGNTSGQAIHRNVDVVLRSGSVATFNESRLSGANSDRLIWHGLRVAGRNSAGMLAAKLAQAKGAIQGRVDAQVLVLSIQCNSNCEIATRTMVNFAKVAAEDLYAAAAASTIMTAE
jgi:EpsI family protein